MGSGDMLRGIVAREMAARSEPWARKLLDPASGQAHPDVVEALAQVAAGLERTEEADGLSEPSSREGLVAWLIDTVIVDPDDPKTAQRPQLQTAVRVQFDDRGEAQPSAPALDALAELVLGAREQSHPHALRVAAPERVVDEYLRGGETSPRRAVVFDATETIEVEAMPLASHPAPRRKTPARRVAAKRAPTKRRPAARAKAGAKKKRKPAAKKAVARTRLRRASKASARKRTPARRKSARKIAVRKKVRAGTRRPAAKHARRKKK